MNQKAYHILSALCSGLLLIAALAQAQHKQNKQSPIILVHADSLISNEHSSGSVRELSGNVHLRQDSVTLTCNVATQFIDGNSAKMRGNVKIVQGSVTLTTPIGTYDGNQRLARSVTGLRLQDRETVLIADEGDYHTGTRIARFRRNVVISNDTVVMWADKLEYHRANKNSFAWGNVTSIARNSKVTLWGDTLHNYPGEHYTIARGNPLLCRVDTAAAQKTDVAGDSSSVQLDTLCILADILEAYRIPGNERYIANSNVRLRRGNLSARCDYGFYDENAGRIYLRGMPVIWLDSTQLTGDSIEIGLHEGELQYVLAYGNAFAATLSDPLYPEQIDQLSGTDIAIRIVRDTLHSITAGDNAFSLTYLYDEEASDGFVRSAADTIHVRFQNGASEKVQLIRGVQGTYTPELLSGTDPGNHRLRDFKWRDDRPHIVPRPLPTLAPPAPAGRKHGDTPRPRGATR